jgi:hypothetical protein
MAISVSITSRRSLIESPSRGNSCSGGTGLGFQKGDLRSRCEVACGPVLVVAVQGRRPVHQSPSGEEGEAGGRRSRAALPPARRRLAGDDAGALGGSVSCTAG